MTRSEHPILPGALAGDSEQVADQELNWPVTASETVYRHPYLSLDVDTVRGPDGDSFDRVYVRHKGAVGIVALDDQQRVLLLEQYRHPVRARLVELPAGVLDRVGESPHDAAMRELGEEGDLRAETLRPLLYLRSTPGFSDEQWQVFLASGLTPVPPAERFARVHEEAHMRRVWVPLEEAVRAVRAGQITNAMAASGLLAAWLDLRAG